MACSIHAQLLEVLVCTVFRLVHCCCRRLEQELKLYCGDVLQTSLAATLSEKLHREAKSEMGE